MKHIVFYSGGIVSWMTAKRVIEKYGKENVILLFADTLIEDVDLYRFIDDTVAEMGVKFYRVADGRTPWEVYKDSNFLGNNQKAPCSYVLKQRVSEDWVIDNFSPDECVLYLGIDWSESHRKIAPVKKWHPYTVQFPMCEPPFMDKSDMFKELEKIGIEVPRLYKMGFSHNNCGAFCCKAGQGHFAKLLKELPNKFKEVEEKEQEVRESIGKDVTILRKQVNKKMYRYSLKQLREDIEANKKVDEQDIGGCGCFLDDINN